ncbi:MAG: hypothetical protein ACK5L3_03305 [Oscillospiraceae bacterium]
MDTRSIPVISTIKTTRKYVFLCVLFFVCATLCNPLFTHLIKLKKKRRKTEIFIYGYLFDTDYVLEYRQGLFNISSFIIEKGIHFMRNKKLLPKTLFSLLAIVAVLIFSAVPVYANGPVPGPSLVIYFDEKLPTDIAYVDLLVPIEVSSNDYSEFNRANGSKFNISDTSQIAQYNENGFVSYTFHFKGASSGMVIQGPEYESSYSVRFETGLEDLESKIDYIEVAFLNSQGDILHITEPIKIASTLKGYFTGGIDINPNTFKVINNGYYKNIWMFIVFPILMIPRMAFSVILEVIIAYIFKLKPLRKIAFLNIATQVILTFFMMATSLSYWQSLIVGELAVYLIEALVMLLAYKTYRKRRIITFVLVANTVTLCLGILLNNVGVFRY